MSADIVLGLEVGVIVVVDGVEEAVIGLDDGVVLVLVLEFQSPV